MDLAVSEHHWAPQERGLQPTIALLSWLICNFREPLAGLKGRPAIVAEPRKLAAGDPATVEKGIELLRTGKRGWHIREGRTYPDAFSVTDDALIVIEGKRTEAGPTTRTSLMAGRHQMLRHLDAAWEIRGRRAVYGMFIVEGDPANGGIPAVWQARRELPSLWPRLRAAFRTAARKSGVPLASPSSASLPGRESSLHSGSTCHSLMT
jgi:hypothetical protein